MIISLIFFSERDEGGEQFYKFHGDLKLRQSNGKRKKEKRDISSALDAFRISPINIKLCQVPSISFSFCCCVNVT